MRHRPAVARNSGPRLCQRERSRSVSRVRDDRVGSVRDLSRDGHALGTLPASQRGGYGRSGRRARARSRPVRRALLAAQRPHSGGQALRRGSRRLRVCDLARRALSAVQRRAHQLFLAAVTRESPGSEWVLSSRVGDVGADGHREEHHAGDRGDLREGQRPAGPPVLGTRRPSRRYSNTFGGRTSSRGATSRSSTISSRAEPRS